MWGEGRGGEGEVELRLSAVSSTESSIQGSGGCGVGGVEWLIIFLFMSKEGGRAAQNLIYS